MKSERTLLATCLLNISFLLFPVHIQSLYMSIVQRFCQKADNLTISATFSIPLLVLMKFVFISRKGLEFWLSDMMVRFLSETQNAHTAFWNTSYFLLSAKEMTVGTVVCNVVATAMEEQELHCSCWNYTHERFSQKKINTMCLTTAASPDLQVIYLVKRKN